MAQRRSTAALVVAIFQILFGVLGLCGAAFQLASSANPFANMQGGAQRGMKAPPTQREIEDAMEKRVPNSKVILTVMTGMEVVLSLMMIGGAVGLLMTRPWGRLVTIAYAAISIVLNPVKAVYGLVYISPVMSDFFQEHFAGGNQQEQMMGRMMQGMMTAAFALAFVVVLYPIIVLVIMLLPSVAASFRGEAKDREPEDYDDRRGDDRFTDEPR